MSTKKKLLIEIEKQSARDFRFWLAFSVISFILIFVIFYIIEKQNEEVEKLVKKKISEQKIEEYLNLVDFKELKKVKSLTFFDFLIMYNENQFDFNVARIILVDHYLFSNKEALLILQETRTKNKINN